VIDDAAARRDPASAGDREPWHRPSAPVPAGASGEAAGRGHHRPRAPRAAARPEVRADEAAETERSETTPDDAHVYRFLAEACVAAGAYRKALEFAEAGLARIPSDSGLIATRGDARSGLCDDEGAVADWQLALDLGSRAAGGGRSARPAPG
jgi:hypothetical protein